MTASNIKVERKERPLIKKGNISLQYFKGWDSNNARPVDVEVAEVSIRQGFASPENIFFISVVDSVSNPDRFFPGTFLEAEKTDFSFVGIKKIFAAFERFINKIFVPRFAASIIAIFFLLVPLFVFSNFGSFSYTVDEGEESLFLRPSWTFGKSSRAIAESHLELHDADKVTVEKFGSTDVISVSRSYPVDLTVDGKTETINVLDISFADLLKSQGIEFDADDIFSHSLSKKLESGDNLVIKKVDYRIRESDEVVPFETIYKLTPMMAEGNSRIVQTGIDGKSFRTYKDRYIDGNYSDSMLLKDAPYKTGRQEIVAVGDPKAPASFIDGSDFMDIDIVDGKPVEYESVIENAVCTAYSFGTGIWGASGMYLVQGFVATNPDVIPYGTLMYIASDKFTYGWAVAADCGTAMMQGLVDIDCYFETYDESCMFGKKRLDVYIVGRLTQSQLEEYAANGMFYSRIPS
jgi:3D (Asp-Asp-Asp) domain-containing protein